MASLRLCLWNANGISKHKNELQLFLDSSEIDVLLISETHLTSKNNFQIPKYTFHATNHPDGKAHGGTGILIKNRIKHSFLNRFETQHLQATAITVQTSCGNTTLVALYCPSRFSISEKEFTDFFNTLGDRFIAAGDYNAKHTHWGSRLVNPKGKQLYNTLDGPAVTKRGLPYLPHILKCFSSQIQHQTYLYFPLRAH